MATDNHHWRWQPVQERGPAATRLWQSRQSPWPASLPAATLPPEPRWQSLQGIKPTCALWEKATLPKRSVSADSPAADEDDDAGFSAEASLGVPSQPTKERMIINIPAALRKSMSKTRLPLRNAAGSYELECLGRRNNTKLKKNFKILTVGEMIRIAVGSLVQIGL